MWIRLFSGFQHAMTHHDALSSCAPPAQAVVHRLKSSLVGQLEMKKLLPGFKT
jgi:hypothetical protein